MTKDSKEFVKRVVVEMVLTFVAVAATSLAETIFKQKGE